MHSTFSVETLQHDHPEHPTPGISNTDKGEQFTPEPFTAVLNGHALRISPDRKGRCVNNFYIERLWRRIKSLQPYLLAYNSPPQAKGRIPLHALFQHRAPTLLARAQECRRPKLRASNCSLQPYLVRQLLCHNPHCQTTAH